MRACYSLDSDKASARTIRPLQTLQTLRTLRTIQTMKRLLQTSLLLLAAGAALADGGPDPKQDPRRAYSTNGWELVWGDEFDGADPSSYLENWRHEVGFVRNHEPQYYTSNRVENCRVEDGALVITARKEKWPNPDYKDRALGGWKRQKEFADYTSADLQSRRDFHYGRIEFRAQMPRERGAWPALWFMGDCIRAKGDAFLNWPACGEIDLVEIWCNDPTAVKACLHTASRGPTEGELAPGGRYRPNELHKVTGGGEFRANKPGMEPWNGFHTYTLDWYEDRLYMFYDGRLYADVDLARSDWPDGRNPFRKPMFILMNLALGGYGNKIVEEEYVDERTGKTVPVSTFPMEMRIDWVRHYVRAGSGD